MAVNEIPLKIALALVGSSTPVVFVGVAALSVSSPAFAATAGIDVTGYWRLVVDRDDSFSAELKHDPDVSKSFQGERIYCGNASRPVGDRRVQVQVCGHVNSANGAFEVIIGGVRACTAPYKPEGTLEGKCVWMGQVEESFSATFVPAPTP
jgi:hypothetical protein